jgi:RNA chaperone Hfq
MAGKGSVQDDYLSKAIASRITMRILLVSGKDLRGTIKACDAFTLTIDVGGGTELLVYKSAIGVIGPVGKGGE